jgi:hypothetical protein
VVLDHGEPESRAECIKQAPLILLGKPPTLPEVHDQKGKFKMTLVKNAVLKFGTFLFISNL